MPRFDGTGRFLGRPDFSWPRSRVLLDYEGDHHRTDRAQWQSDVRRFSRFQEHGWVALRASTPDYRDPGPLLQRLAVLLLLRRRRESTDFG